MSDAGETRKLKAGFRWWRFVISPGNPDGQLLSPMRNTVWKSPELAGDSIYACPSVEALKLWQDAPKPDEIVLQVVRNGYRILRVECSVPGMVLLDPDAKPTVQWWMFSANKVRISHLGDTGGAANRALVDVISSRRPIAVTFGVANNQGRGFGGFAAGFCGEAAHSFLNRIQLVNADQFGGNRLETLGARWGVKVVDMPLLQACGDPYQLVSRAPQFLRANANRPLAEEDLARELVQGLPEIVMFGTEAEVDWATKKADEYVDLRHDLIDAVGHIIALNNTNISEWAWAHVLDSLEREHWMPVEILTSEHKSIRDRAWSAVDKLLQDPEVSEDGLPTPKLSQLIIQSVPGLVAAGELSRIDAWFDSAAEQARYSVVGALPQLIASGDTRKVEKALECIESMPARQSGRALLSVLSALVGPKSADAVRLARRSIETILVGDAKEAGELVKLVHQLELLNDPVAIKWAWGLVRTNARELDADIATDFAQDLFNWTDLKGKPRAFQRVCDLIKEMAATDPDGLFCQDIERTLPMLRDVLPKRQFESLVETVAG